MNEPVNPYASPQAFEPPQRMPAATPFAYARPYRSAAGKARVAVWATAATLFLQALLIVSFGMQLAMLYGAKSGIAVTPAAGQANDVRHYIIAGLSIPAAITSLISLLVWIYAAHANLPALRGTNLEFSDGWAVGWFFVPIANLVKPYQVVREIWRSSDPGTLLGQIGTGTALIGWWWGLRITSAIGGRIFTVMSKETNTVDEFISISWIAIVLTMVIDLPLQAAQIMLIRTVQRFQEDRHELLVKQAEAAPSPPGVNPFAGLS